MTRHDFVTELGKLLHRAMARHDFVTELGKLLHRSDTRISLSLMDKGNAVCVVYERYNSCIADYIDITGDGKMTIAQKVLQAVTVE